MNCERLMVEMAFLLQILLLLGGLHILLLCMPFYRDIGYEKIEIIDNDEGVTYVIDDRSVESVTYKQLNELSPQNVYISFGMRKYRYTIVFYDKWRRFSFSINSPTSISRWGIVIEFDDDIMNIICAHLKSWQRIISATSSGKCRSIRIR